MGSFVRFVVLVVLVLGLGGAQRAWCATPATLWPGDAFPVSWFWQGKSPKHRVYWRMIKRGQYTKAVALWSQRNRTKCARRTLDGKRKVSDCKEATMLLRWCVSVGDEACAVAQAKVLQRASGPALRLGSRLLLARMYGLMGRWREARATLKRWPARRPRCPKQGKKRANSCWAKRLWAAGAWLRRRARYARRMRSQPKRVQASQLCARGGAQAVLQRAKKALVRKQHTRVKSLAGWLLRQKRYARFHPAARLLLLRSAYRQRPGWSNVMAYARFGQTHLRLPIGGKALLWAARLAIEHDAQAYASRWYRRCASACPHKTQRQSARFSLALVMWQRGAYRVAVSLLKPLARGNGAQAARSRYWLGQAMSALRRPAQARVWMLRVRLRHDAYYAAKAADFISTKASQKKGWRHLSHKPMRIFGLLHDDVAARKGRWLVTRWAAQQSPPVKLRDLARKVAHSPLFARASQAALALRFLRVKRVFRALRRRHKHPLVDFLLAQAWLAFGHHHNALRAASRFSSRLTTAQRKSFPFEPMQRLLYPLPFLYLYAKAAKRTGVSPLLMLAVSRQESLFDPQARSQVGAYGLLQLMPRVARSIARRWQIRRWSQRKLKRVPMQLKMGFAHFLLYLQRYQNDVPLALAAYNAGPRPLGRWISRHPRWISAQRDLFFEWAIGYAETRQYIRKCLRGYALYVHLFLDDAVSP